MIYYRRRSHSDAESSFFISIYRDEKSKLKWRVTPSFAINILPHAALKDIELLESIKNTLGVGKVRKNSKTGSSTAVFRVDNIQELEKIIKHFIEYPLISAKLSDFLLFKECFDLIKKKEHLTQGPVGSGLEKIVSLRYNLNKGLTDELLNSFPNIIPSPLGLERPKYSFKKIPEPNWVSGFASGDSSFSVSIEKVKIK